MSVEWNGLEEFKRQLRDLPESLTGQASAIVRRRAERAYQDIETSYPEVTGNLRKGLRLTQLDNGKLSVAVILKNTAKHATLYDNGTQVRHTARGANRGQAPATHVFIRNVSAQRRAMFGELKQMLIDNGLRVTGDA